MQDNLNCQPPRPTDLRKSVPLHQTDSEVCPPAFPPDIQRYPVLCLSDIRMYQAPHLQDIQRSQVLHLPDIRRSQVLHQPDIQRSPVLDLSDIRKSPVLYLPDILTPHLPRNPPIPWLPPQIPIWTISNEEVVATARRCPPTRAMQQLAEFVNRMVYCRTGILQITIVNIINHS